MLSADESCSFAMPTNAALGTASSESVSVEEEVCKNCAPNTDSMSRSKAWLNLRWPVIQVNVTVQVSCSVLRAVTQQGYYYGYDHYLILTLLPPLRYYFYYYHHYNTTTTPNTTTTTTATPPVASQHSDEEDAIRGAQQRCTALLVATTRASIVGLACGWERRHVLHFGFR